jgi:hypothetical protein
MERHTCEAMDRRIATMLENIKSKKMEKKFFNQIASP